MERFLVTAGFTLLGRAANQVSRYDQTVSEELKSWPEGFTVKLQVFGGKSTVVLSVRNGRLTRRLMHEDACSLKIIIKNRRSAAKIILARLSLPEVNARNGIIIEGSTMHAMRFVRIAKSIMSYLYPDFMLKGIMQKLPENSWTRIKNRLRIILLGVIAGREVF